MKSVSLIKSSLSVVTALTLYACSGSADIEIVYQSQNCGIDIPSLRKLTDTNEISALQPAPISLNREDKTTTAPSTGVNVDLSKNYLALVALGQKSTAGYSLDAIAEQIKVKNKVLHLPETIEKPANAMVAQMITSPCAVIALKKSDYEAIHWGNKKLTFNKQ